MFSVICLRPMLKEIMFCHIDFSAANFAVFKLLKKKRTKLQTIKRKIHF